MEKLKINPENKKYYSDEFIKGFECGVERQFNADVEEKTAEWIPVSERLPEESLNSVIGWDAYRKRCVFVQFIDGHFQITGKNESFDIQAWMPLPEPYKAE